jgi:hypothetical protein
VAASLKASFAFGVAVRLGGQERACVVLALGDDVAFASQPARLALLRYRLCQYAKAPNAGFIVVAALPLLDATAVAGA